MAEQDKLRFLTGQESNLGSKAVTRGQVYFAINSDQNSGKIYFDAPADKVDSSGNLITQTKRIVMNSDHADKADYATNAGHATSADQAKKDSNQKVISETYISEMKLDAAGTTILYKYPDIAKWKELKPKFLPLTGGTITGELYVDGGSTLASLLVNGDARFVNTIQGNIKTADKWKTARGFQIADSGAANTGVSVNVDGSGNVVLKLPATIKATLQGNADSATKATNDSNNKKITDEYLHRVSNSSATLNQFSGAPKYILGIEAFTDGGEVKWQSSSSVKVGSADGADKWNTARNFSISDSGAAHTGTAVSVDGSKAVVLPLPATIKATLEGNASSATRVNHKYTLTLGTAAQTAFDGSADVAITITPSSIGALASDANAVSATKLQTARKIAIADNGAANTGVGVDFDGTKDIVIQLPATIKASITGHASEDLPLAGGAMTGNISYKGSKATTSMIRFLDNTANTYGNGISIGGGGVTVIGAGESSQGLTPAADEETLYLTSDGSIKFYTYCDTIGNKRGVILDSSRNFYPDVNNSGSIGTSSNKWKSMYATTFYGALSGTASNATSDIRGNAIINTYLTNVYAKSDDSSYLYKQVGPASERSAELIGRYTPLDSDGLINMKYIPAAALERVVVVANQAAQYALTTANVQLGDVVKRNDTGQLYFVVDTNNLGNANGYLQFTAGTAANVNWSGVLNRPNVVGRATGNAIVPNAANTEFTVYQVNGDGTSTSYVIKPNFLPKTGGTITGELYIDGGTTLASLLVNGDARFVNTIQGNISGNAATANKWTNSRVFYIADSGAAHTGVGVNVDGSGNVTLKLPAIITATLKGTADNADTVDNKHANEFIYYGGDDTNLGSGSPAATAKAYFLDNAKTPVGMMKGYYNHNGVEYSQLYSRSTSGGYGSILRWGYADRYMYILRYRNGWQSEDWEKMDAGNADKWTTARNFQISDSGAAHTGTAVSVNGSKNIVLPLPATIKAALEGNADTATKLTNLTSTDQASSTNTWRRIWFSYDDNVNGRPAYSDTFAYQSSTGTVKATKFQGALAGNATSADKWKTARNFITNLGSESPASVDGSTGPYNLGVTGTLPVSHGGTGNTAFTANRIIYSESATKLSSSSHYMSNSQVSINSSSAPTSGVTLNINGATTTSNYIKIDGSSGTTATTNYISLGRGYGTGSGKNGLKVVVCDQSDAQTGLGQDLYGSQWELSLATTANGSHGRITFGYNTASAWSTYTEMGHFSVSDKSLTVIGNVIAPNFKGLADKATGDGSGHNIEETYLKRSGGTMTGTINSQIVQPKTNNTYTLGGSSNRWSTLYSVNIDNTGSWTWYGSQNFLLKATANGQEWSFDQCYGSTSYTGTYSQFWSSKNSVSIIRFYTDDNQVQIPSTGFMGIGGAGDANYKLKVTGNTYLTGTLYVGGSSTFNSNLTVNSGGKVKIQNTTDSKNSQDSEASVAIQGGVSVAKQLSAKSVRIDNQQSDKGCTVKFNYNTNCIEFVFD